MTDDLKLVTVITTFRNRFVVQADAVVTDELLQGCEPFSESWVNDVVVSEATGLTMDALVEQFDVENEYLRSWDRDQKVAMILRNVGAESERY